MTTQTEQTNQTAPKAKIFKSYMPFLRIPFSDGSEAIFRYNRLVTTNPKLIAKVLQLVEDDPALGIYIDPNEYETDQLPAGTDYDLRQKQLREFMAQAATQVDAGTSPQASGFKTATTADSPTTGGKSAPAPHFTRAETEALLKSRTVSADVKPTT